MIPFRSGYAALLGRPNVGKSSLVNRLVGQKVSIVSPKPHTTRFSVMGVLTEDASQVVFVDAPGTTDTHQSMLSRIINREAAASVEGVDAILFVVEARGWSPADELALDRARGLDCPVFLVINKIDKAQPRERLLPLIDAVRVRYPFAGIIPVSAQTGENMSALLSAVRDKMPIHPAHFPPDQVSDRNLRFQAAEAVREQLMRQCNQELPYVVAVEVEEYAEKDQQAWISAVIWVEKPGQRAIIIGEKGAHLKSIGTRARLEMQKLFGHRVHLKLWVRVREGWRDNARWLKSLGYTTRE